MRLLYNSKKSPILWNMKNYFSPSNDDDAGMFVILGQMINIEYAINYNRDVEICQALRLNNITEVEKLPQWERAKKIYFFFNRRYWSMGYDPELSGDLLPVVSSRLSRFLPVMLKNKNVKKELIEYV